MNTKKLIILLGAFIALHAAIVLLLPPPSEASDLTVQNILSAINKERVARNLLALNENNLLDAAAIYKANDMQARHYFAHIDPDNHYIWDKIVSLGYSPYLELGENLAINFYDTESLTDAWMQSPEHRANILNDGFKDQGMGVNLGNVQQGQYYSAIANTFGTLAVTAKPAAPKLVVTTPPPTPVIVPAPKNVTTSTPVVSEPSAKPVVGIRGSNESASSTPTEATTTAATTSPIHNTPAPVAPAAAVVNTSNPLTSAQANRYLSLIFGLIILAFLGRDVWSYIKEKGAHLDKKINNLALLIMALIVVGLMYWL